MILAPSSLLAQVTTTAGPSMVYSATYQTEITRINVANTIATNDRFSIWHADEGQPATAGCALFLSNVISGQSTITPILSAIDGAGLSVKAGGRIYCGSSATDAVTFSIYGVTRAGR